MNNISFFDLVTYALLLLWTFVVLFPLYWTFTTSFKQKRDIFQGPKFIPWLDFEPTIRWWREILTTENDQLTPSLINSLILSLVSSFFATWFGTMGAYALTRYDFKLGFMTNADILLWIVSQRMMPPIIIALALFIMFQWFNLVDTRFGMILIYIMFNLPLAVWIMRNFLNQLPESIEESAEVDGAPRWQIFFRIVVPMTWPSMTATFLICFIFAWNEFLFALILTFKEARTIPILIASQHFQRGPQWWDLSALTLVAVIPVIVICISLQRFLIYDLVPTQKG